MGFVVCFGNWSENQVIEDSTGLWSVMLMVGGFLLLSYAMSETDRSLSEWGKRG